MCGCFEYCWEIILVLFLIYECANLAAVCSGTGSKALQTHCLFDTQWLHAVRSAAFTYHCIEAAEVEMQVHYAMQSGS